MNNDKKINGLQHKIYGEILDEQKKITRHIDAVEHARIVRGALKEKFPEIKFRVRSSSFAGGSAVDVWHVGGKIIHVKHKEITEFVRKFNGYRGDLMDSIYNVGFEWKNERLCGATFCSYQGGTDK